MSVITIRLPENLLRELNKSAQTIHIPRTEYIRLAIKHMNEETIDQEHKKMLQAASLRVRKESMRINAEFSQIEHDPKM